MNEPGAWWRILMLADSNVRWVMLGSALLGASGGVLGCFAFLRRRALLGDALAHAALPGICLAFLLFQSRDPLLLLLGAVASGLLGTGAIRLITQESRVKEDSAIAIVLSVFFGLGIVLLTLIQRSGNAAQAGLDKFLFGQAAALVDSDVQILAGLSTILLVAVFLLYKEFKIVSFDEAFGATMGLRVRVIDAILMLLIVLGVCIGLSAVGVVLMAAMLVTPPAAARFWTDRLSRMLLLSALFGAASGVLGTIISALAPRMPTGPWMVSSATVIFAISLLLAPRRGILARALLFRSNRRRRAEENLLTTLYRLGEADGAMGALRPLEDLAGRRSVRLSEARRVLRRLERDGLTLAGAGSDAWRLTPPGEERARRVIRLHRLWEIYLTERLHLAQDHVHDDAEEIEHFITPELEAELETILQRPRLDPHGRQIPYAASAADADGPLRRSGHPS